MAGSTTNIGLIKPTYSEDADVAIINENMDTLDSTISALDNGLAIVSNNNTHGAITAGQYVYVRNHGSLAEGMYTANSNIAANATLSSSNLTAASSGSLNKLNSDLAELNSKMMQPSNISYGDITGTSLQQIETALTSATVGMRTGDIKCCSCYANYSGSMTSGSQGLAFLSKVTTSVWYVFIVSIAGVKVGYMTNNTWNWL